MNHTWLDRLPRHPATTTLLAVAMLAADYVTGPHIRFPITFVLPVALAAWRLERRRAWLFALGMPAVRLAWVHLLWRLADESLFFETLNTVIQVAMLTLIAMLALRAARHQRALEAEVRALEGMLTVCAHCKQIRDKSGVWHPMEVFITQHSETSFSHTFCPTCMQTNYKEFFKPGEPAGGTQRTPSVK
ncbi:MAG: hypothetical protein HY301_20870 [Verrucomicrobia bacterium]|nr:hypothetical protein [Verrucomicrobiota bacterium]